MAEEKKTTRKTAPKKTTSKKTSKKSEVVEVKEPVEPIVSEEIVTSEEKGIYVKIATVLPEEGLNVRTGPDAKAPKYGKLKAGTEVEVLEEKDGFVRIGQDQWVMKSYLGGI